jgi:hypothetical protein
VWPLENFYFFGNRELGFVGVAKFHSLGATPTKQNRKPKNENKHLFLLQKNFNHQTNNMTTKTTNIIYWVSTVIFAGLMAFSASGGLQPSQPAIQLIHDTLGFPVYFIQFISVAKLIGCIVILIPGINRSVKDWAYAGLFFDLTGAIYSGIAISGKFDPMMLTMLMWIVPGIVSYYFWHKKMQAESLSVRS